MKQLLSDYDIVAIVSHLTKNQGEVFGSQSPDNIALLVEVARQLPENAVCVEIGTRVGYSAAAFLLGNLRLSLTTIDKEDYGSSIADTFKFLEAQDYFGHFYKTDEWNLEKRIKPVQRSSVIVGEEWEGCVDYLFIDGDHSYLGLFDDLNAWLPKTKVGSVVGFHDYGHPPNDNMGVTEVVNGVMFHEHSLEWRLYKANYQMAFFQKQRV